MALVEKRTAPFVGRPLAWGLAVGVVNVAAPAAIWWLDLATVHSLTITLIAAVYVGFAVADGRPRVIAVEASVALLFMLIAASAVTGSAWLLVVGYFAHGGKDLWQHRTQFVTGTRWWPPFCAAVDWVVALIIGIEIVAGIHFHPSP